MWLTIRDSTLKVHDPVCSARSRPELVLVQAVRTFSSGWFAREPVIGVLIPLPHIRLGIVITILKWKEDMSQ